MEVSVLIVKPAAILLLASMAVAHILMLFVAVMVYTAVQVVQFATLLTLHVINQMDS